MRNKCVSRLPWFNGAERWRDITLTGLYDFYFISFPGFTAIYHIVSSAAETNCGKKEGEQQQTDSLQSHKLSLTKRKFLGPIMVKIIVHVSKFSRYLLSWFTRG